MIGIDFDNTIVRYDDVFGRVALDLGLVPPEAATSKTAVRDHLRATGRDDRWTELQGIVYGPRMMDASPFPGVIEFFQACRAVGLPIAIVSHRTRFPYLGERHDLHAAARDWLARQGFHDPTGIGLPTERVFFEETKEAKLARIAELGCTHFIEDLPELLAHPAFPQGVRRILFDPHGQHHAMRGIDPASSWQQLAGLLLAGFPLPRPPGEAGRRPGEGAGGRPVVAEASSPTLSPMRRGSEDDQCPGSDWVSLFASAGLPAPTSITRLFGGGNNRAYRVETAAGPLLLKEYFRHPADLRDRLGAEYAFSRFAWDNGVRALPRPIACDERMRLALYEFIAGRKLTPGEVTAAHVDEAAAFFAAVNRHRHDAAAATLPIASEACFSLAEHVDCVDRRLARLERIEPDTAFHRQAARLVAGRLLPLWERVRSALVANDPSDEAALDVAIPVAARVISPSDFGFHNCIVASAGAKFIDFEYAGWDDPTKMVCDFFCQPAVPVPREHLKRFLAAVSTAVGNGFNLTRRVEMLLPVYEVKWCCIMLNDFLAPGHIQRTFARPGESLDARRANQLRKVAHVLDRLA